MTTSGTNQDSYEIESLLVAAFHAAQRRGKQDWHRMRISVLKNRLLQLSGREFDERKHGANSFREMLAQYPHILRLAGPDVELIVEKGVPEAKQRIRSDLWRAVMDYSSGRRYKWDTVQQRVRPAEDEDSLIIPTLSREGMDGWRKEFVDACSGNHDLETWRAQGMPTTALPFALQGPWTVFVRDHVVERLSKWFAEQGLSVDPFSPPPGSATAQPSPNELRTLVMRCVAVMTAEELAALKLPATAVLRAFAGDQ